MTKRRWEGVANLLQVGSLHSIEMTSFMRTWDPRYIRPITHDNHRTVSYFHIRSPPLSAVSGVVTLTGSGELILVLAPPPAWLWETPGPHLSPLVPGLASQSQWTLPCRRKWWITTSWTSHRYFVTIAAYIVEQNGSPVNMRRSDNECNYNATARLWNNKTKVRSMFC